jgi:hypothetical protein
VARDLRSDAAELTESIEYAVRVVRALKVVASVASPPLAAVRFLRALRRKK